MSRYRVPHDTHEVWCGFDNSLSSLFCQVFAPLKDPDDLTEDEVVLVNVGNWYDAIKTVRQLQEALDAEAAQHRLRVILPPDIIAKLERDMAGATPRTSLQEYNRRLFEKLREEQTRR